MVVVSAPAVAVRVLMAGPPAGIAGSTGVVKAGAGCVIETGASSAPVTSAFLLSTTVGAFVFLGGTCI